MMDIWLDTTNIHTIQQAERCGLLSGITTNPTLVAQSKMDFDSLLADLLHHQEFPLAVQVVADTTRDMVLQGQNLHSYSNRIIIKVPASKEGLEAIYLLSRQGIPTMATAIFHPHQALLFAWAGANYIAPYVGRIEKSGRDPWEMLKSLMQIFHNYRIKTKILAASLNDSNQVFKCAEAGIYGVTVKDELFEKMIQTDSLTESVMKQFQSDWSSIQTHSIVF